LLYQEVPAGKKSLEGVMKQDAKRIGIWAATLLGTVAFLVGGPAAKAKSPAPFFVQVQLHDWAGSSIFYAFGSDSENSDTGELQQTAIDAQNSAAHFGPLISGVSWGGGTSVVEAQASSQGRMLQLGKPAAQTFAQAFLSNPLFYSVDATQAESSATVSWGDTITITGTGDFRVSVTLNSSISETGGSSQTSCGLNDARLLVSAIRKSTDDEVFNQLNILDSACGPPPSRTLKATFHAEAGEVIELGGSLSLRAYAAANRYVAQTSATVDAWNNGDFKLDPITAGASYTTASGGVYTTNPIANGGPDQTVNDSAVVALNGSGSIDPDGRPLMYKWTQIAGPPVSLNLADPVRPTFTAPSVPVDGRTLTFSLVVNNGTLNSAPDEVNVNVSNVNHPPVAVAGTSQTVSEGSPVKLDGAASYDPDGETVTYRWKQTVGPTVTLSDSHAASPTFTAPLVGWAGAVLAFELTVSDGRATGANTVQVTVENVNHPPSVNAGPDQTKDEGAKVSLTGLESTDPDGDTLAYTWAQVTGSSVVLSDATSATPTFTAPAVGFGGAKLTFRLTGTDPAGASATDEVTVSVRNVNDPPACTLARPTVRSLWPPVHRMIAVGITGVADPNKDLVTLTITGVTQDEPVSKLEAGDTGPDAAIQGSGVLLRAERASWGNGRVYQVTFTADDGRGGTCSGAVKVTAPITKNGSAVDNGQIYNSLKP
jgi:hypothetical protein